MKHYKEYYHQIWVCSPTVNNDDKWDIVKDTKHVLKKNTALEHALNSQGKKNKLTHKVVFKDEEAMMKKQKDPKEEWTGKKHFYGYVAKRLILAR